MVALRSGTAEYAPIRNSLSDRNYRQGNEQDNVQGNAKADDLQGNTKEDDVQNIDEKNNSPTALNAIIPRMTRSTTKKAAADSGLGIVHPVFAAKAASPNDAMDPEVIVNAINKEVRGLFNRGAFSLVHVNAVPSHANIIGTRIITRQKHFGKIDEEAKARLIFQGCQDVENNRTVSNDPTVFHASIRILISFAGIKDCPVWTKDTTQAFLQSKDTFTRDLYARLPLELRSVFKVYVLKMLKPLHGTKEAGTYWNAACSEHWKQRVGVTSSTLDPCFMTATCNQGKDAPHQIAAILMDDTLKTGNKHFAKLKNSCTATTISDKHRPSLTVRRLSLAECRSVEIPMAHCVYHKKLTMKTYQTSRQICTTIFLYAKCAAKCPGSLHGPVPMQPSPWEDLAR
jgi:Reverse transcriptase (RNA-dependent DNA polymerase)